MGGQMWRGKTQKYFLRFKGGHLLALHITGLGVTLPFGAIRSRDV